MRPWPELSGASDKDDQDDQDDQDVQSEVMRTWQLTMTHPEKPMKSFTKNH
jgi:hypothetical protein